MHEHKEVAHAQRDRAAYYPHMPSAIVIGAGPAGSVAAFVLASAGWDVTVIEQHRFPRDKVCGECLSALGITCLKRLGLFAAIENSGAVPLRWAVLRTANGDSGRIKLPEPMWGLSRSVLDATLLNGARDAGASIQQPARFEGFEGAAVRIRNLESNEVRSLQADHVIIADGKPPKRRWRDFGIKAHFEGLNGPVGAIELFGCRGLYGGIAPIENGRWNLCFSVPAKRVQRSGGNIDSLFEQIRTENPALDQRLKSGTRMTRWLSAPLPRFQAAAIFGSNALRVGNAAAALEPIGGEGMGLAIASAEIAAQSLIKGQLDSLDSQYKSLWRIRRLGCRVAGLVVSRPMLLRLPVLLFQPSTPIPAFGFSLIGK